MNLIDYIRCTPDFAGALIQTLKSPRIMHKLRIHGIDAAMTSRNKPTISHLCNALAATFKPLDPWNIVAANAAGAGDLDMLQWAAVHIPTKSLRICTLAALAGHLHILQWAHANEFPWDEMTCAAAAEGGHLEVLQWLRGGTVEAPSKSLFISSAYRVAYERPCPWDGRTRRYATSNGHLQVLQWAIENGAESYN
jgi:hypothetical protein